MFVGVIKTKDILLHPVHLIRIRGFKGYCKLVWRALKKQPYSFIGMTQQSDWIFDERIKKKVHAETRHAKTSKRQKRLQHTRGHAAARP